MIVILLVGVAAGYLAGRFARGSGSGLVGDAAVGIVGALIANWPSRGFDWLERLIALSNFPKRGATFEMLLPRRTRRSICSDGATFASAGVTQRSAEPTPGRARRRQSDHRRSACVADDWQRFADGVTHGFSYLAHLPGALLPHSANPNSDPNPSGTR